MCSNVYSIESYNTTTGTLAHYIPLEVFPSNLRELYITDNGMTINTDDLRNLLVHVAPRLEELDIAFNNFGTKSPLNIIFLPCLTHLNVGVSTISAGKSTTTTTSWNTAANFLVVMSCPALEAFGFFFGEVGNYTEDVWNIMLIAFNALAAASAGVSNILLRFHPQSAWKKHLDIQAMITLFPNLLRLAFPAGLLAADEVLEISHPILSHIDILGLPQEKFYNLPLMYGVPRFPLLNGTQLPNWTTVQVVIDELIGVQGIWGIQRCDNISLQFDEDTIIRYVGIKGFMERIPFRRLRIHFQLQLNIPRTGCEVKCTIDNHFAYIDICLPEDNDDGDLMYFSSSTTTSSHYSGV